MSTSWLVCTDFLRIFNDCIFEGTVEDMVESVPARYLAIAENYQFIL
jgi:hypothetical protein